MAITKAIPTTTNVAAVAPVEQAGAERRRDKALILSLGGAVIMTIYAFCGLYLLQGQPEYIFKLSVGALLIIFLILSGFIGLLVRREFILSKDGIIIRDSLVKALANNQEDLVERHEAEDAVEEAVKDLPPARR